MQTKKIAVRLNDALASENRGLCDPDDPRNDQVITPAVYGAKGYLEVHPSGFIRAQIRSGNLLEVHRDVQKRPSGGASKAGKKGSRRSGK